MHPLAQRLVNIVVWLVLSAVISYVLGALAPDDLPGAGGRHEAQIRACLVDPREIDVTLADVGGLEAVKQERDSAAVEGSLAAIRTAADDPTVNLMPPIIDAVKTYATEEEISNAMRDVFGTYVEQAIV